MKEPFLEKPLRILRRREILKCISADSGFSVCDIGCGAEPWFLLKIEPRISEGWGIDKKIAAKKWGNKIEIINQDLDRDPLTVFSENKFDYVTMAAVIEHFAFPGKVLKESYRILKPGGLIILTTPTEASKSLLDFLTFRLGLVSKDEVGDHKNCFSGGKLEALLADAGFRNIKLRNFEFGFNQIIIGQK